MHLLRADNLEIDPYYLYKMRNDRLQTKFKYVSSTIVKNEDIIKKPQFKIPTVNEIREKQKELEKSFEDRKPKDTEEEPNIGIKLIKTFQRMSLIQEYYGQLIEDIENRLLSNYESSIYNENLKFIKDASPSNIKVALVLIFNKNCKQTKCTERRINDLKYKFPAFSILKDKDWLEKSLILMLDPERCPDVVYSNFMYKLGEKLGKQFESYRNIKNYLIY